MNTFWKPAVFIFLNAVFVVINALLVSTYRAVYSGEDPLALLGVLVMDIAFAAIGIALLLLARVFPVPPLNRWLPFLAIIGFTATAIANVSPVTLVAGMVIGAALALAAVVTTVLTLRRGG